MSSPISRNAQGLAVSAASGSPTTHPVVEHVDKAANVKSYHQNLASHLMSMIRRVGTDTTKANTNSSIPPPNSRQHSDSSLESDSKISSGITTDTNSKQSSFSSPPSPDVVQDSEERVKGIVKGLSDLSISRSQSDPASPSARHDLTARPTLLPPRFATGHSEPSDNGAGPSFHPSPLRASPQISPLSKSTRNAKFSRADTDIREQEHRRAWEAEGRRVWRHIPHGFELKLQPKKRAGSHGSSDSLEASVHSGPSGAGPGNAIRADDTLGASGLVNELDRVTSIATLPESSSEVSRPEAPSSPASVPKSHSKQLSTLQRRQDKLDHQDQELALGRRRTIQPVQSATTSIDEEARYHEKRAARLARMEDRLNKRIGSWWVGVQAEWAAAISIDPAEIKPDCPSPDPVVSQLRFLPLDADLPDIFKTKTPALKLPPLQIVGETRKNRLKLIDEWHTESDVDLLIRLAEVNRLHSTGSRSFAPTPLTPRSRDEKVDIGRMHSLNVRTTMSTPKPKQYKSFTPVE